MKEYKVLWADNVEQSEVIMNKMAADGWRVISTTLWHNFKVGLVITFEREKKEEREKGSIK